MRASFSLEAMLVFVGVALFWIGVFSMVAPKLEQVKAKAVDAELRAECEKLAGVVDTMATYGAESTFLDLTPYFQSAISRGIYFCQEHQKCTGRNVTAVLFRPTSSQKVSCTTHVASWVNVLKGGEPYTCDRVPQSGNFSVEFGSYVERGGVRECG